MREKPPQFIRQFSKEESQDDRNATAKSIKENRASRQEREKELSREVARLRDLSRELDELSSGGIKRLVNYFKIKDLQTKKQESQESQSQLSIEVGASTESYTSQRLLENFYERQIEKWRNAPFTQEDLETYFTEEYLAGLSLSEYKLLLKRFPGEMVTHVTRQGVRDHSAMIYHSAGVGEKSDGFKDILRDGRLRSPLSAAIVQHGEEEAVKHCLNLEKYSTKEEAQARLEKLTDWESQGDQGTYADRTAIHFAAQEVADMFYGSERGNEIFIAYPSALIASQYNFRGDIATEGGGYWNDAWVWTQEDQGIDINASVVFIPSDAPVDPQSGSRYKINEDGKPIVNIDLMQKAQAFTESDRFPQIADSLLKLYRDSGDSPSEALRVKQTRERVQDILSKDFGIENKELAVALTQGAFLYHCRLYQEQEKKGAHVDNWNKPERYVADALKECGQYYQYPENIVSSQEYWETYLKEHLEVRPSKIVYYTGGDPTLALKQWQVDTSHSKNKGHSLGGRGVTPQQVPRLRAGCDRFRAIAQDIINKTYPASNF